MVVSGVPKRNGLEHAGHIASMAVDLVKVCESFVIPHKQETKLRIRAGIHSGIFPSQPPPTSTPYYLFI